MSKSALLKLLIAVNLALAAALVVVRSTPRTAAAQASPLADNYMVVTGQIESNNDALYIIDTKERTLHTFTIRKGTREIEYAGYRMLERDFRHNRN